MKSVDNKTYNCHEIRLQNHSKDLQKIAFIKKGRKKERKRKNEKEKCRK